MSNELSSLDSSLYDAFEQVAKLGVPISWVPDDVAKWELLGRLRRQMREATRSELMAEGGGG